MADCTAGLEADLTGVQPLHYCRGSEGVHTPAQAEGLCHVACAEAQVAG
jgi:hypothetical protein